MNISVGLTPELFEYLEKKVKSGKYKSRSEVVREAVRMMMNRLTLKESLRRRVIDLEKFEDERDKVSGKLIDRK